MRQARLISGVRQILVVVGAVVAGAMPSAGEATAAGPVAFRSRLGDVCLDAPSSADRVPARWSPPVFATADLSRVGTPFRERVPATVQLATTTMTPGGWSATSGVRGWTGAFSSAPTASAVSFSPGALPKYTVVVDTLGSVRLPTSVTL
jgi:hypothetical protein